MRLPSFGQLREGLKHILSRFTVAMIFLLLYAVYGVALVWEALSLGYEHEAVVLYYLSMGVLLNVVLCLWGEETSRAKRMIVSIVANVLLLADTIYMLCIPVDDLDSSIAVGRASGIVALMVLGAFLPYHKEKDDVASWTFTKHVAGYTLASVLSCLLVYGGLMLLIASLNMLFDIHVDEEWYGTFAVLLCTVVPAMMIMAKLPEGEGKFVRTAHTGKFLLGIVRWLILPLAALYLLVLYVYAVKILIDWELPNGGVCYLITALMVVCVVVELLLYPNMRGDAHPFERWIVRWLPVCILPLLLLMSVSIGRRLSDYDITVNRLYMVTLNVWYYVVCIGLFVCRARRIHWIAVSFAILFVLTSFGPVNYYTITRTYIQNRLQSMMVQCQPASLPMSDEAYMDWTRKVGKEKADVANDLLHYLYNTYSARAVKEYVVNPNVLYDYDRGEAETNRKYVISYSSSDRHPVPEGYAHFESVDFSDECNAEDSTLWHLRGNNDKGTVLTLDINKLDTVYKDGRSLVWCVDGKSSDCMYVVSSIYISSATSGENYMMRHVYITGYLFTK